MFESPWMRMQPKLPSMDDPMGGQVDPNLQMQAMQQGMPQMQPPMLASNLSPQGVIVSQSMLRAFKTPQKKPTPTPVPKQEQAQALPSPTPGPSNLNATNWRKIQNGYRNTK